MAFCPKLPTGIDGSDCNVSTRPRDTRGDAVADRIACHSDDVASLRAATTLIAKTRSQSGSCDIARDLRIVVDATFTRETLVHQILSLDMPELATCHKRTRESKRRRLCSLSSAIGCDGWIIAIR